MTVEDRVKGKPWNPDQDKYFRGVFGKRTLMTLYKLANKGYIKSMGGEISRGKEAAVFVSETFENKCKEEDVIIKIYKPHPSFNMMKYIRGDPRFEGLSKRKMIKAWAKKEFKNLGRFVKLGISVPKPFDVMNNVLVMEFINEEDNPARTYKVNPPENPEKAFKTVREYLKKGYEGGIVHGDLSEYNILNQNHEPVLIDCGQAVVKKHPLFMDFLERDIKNMVSFFSRLGVKCTNKEVEEYVLSSNTKG